MRHRNSARRSRLSSIAARAVGAGARVARPAGRNPRRSRSRPRRSAHHDRAAAERPEILHPDQARPVQRAELRLAIDVGSVFEDDDQLGWPTSSSGVRRQRQWCEAGSHPVQRSRSACGSARVNASGLRRDRLHACRADRHQGSDEQGVPILADVASGLSFDPRPSTTSAASSSRNGGEGAAPTPGCGISSCRSAEGSRHGERLPIGMRDSIEHSQSLRRSSGSTRTGTGRI
jgi:hypothetical protein